MIFFKEIRVVYINGRIPEMKKKHMFLESLPITAVWRCQMDEIQRLNKSNFRYRQVSKKEEEKKI